jgi:AcrR family transcriptional regulator
LKRREQENSRTKLLRAGLEIFSRHGFHGATTKSIASKAGANEALIMRHFQSKEGLFLAVIREKHAQNILSLKLPEKKSLEDEFVQYGREKLKLNWKSENLLRMLLSQVIAEGDLAKRVRKVLCDDELCSPLFGRVKYFKKIGQIHKSYSIEDVAMLVDKQIFVTFIIHALLVKSGLAEAQRQLAIALRTIAKGLQKK